MVGKSSNVRQSSVSGRISRLRQSFREGAHHVSSAIREDVESLIRVRKPPKWIIVLKKVYHEYGLKHVCLISILVIYQFLGAGVFYLCEAEFDEQKEEIWNMRIAENRSNFVTGIVPLMFNNTDYLFFLTQEQTNQVFKRLEFEIVRYEKQLGIKYTDQKIKWDFWNAMLYAQTICTTIGYGHLYPSTAAGRVFTMFYAIFGIPLVLSILDDLGKLLTRCLKTPWWLIKCACRRAFRYCTKQTVEEIEKLDEEDKRDLEIFDLPIPIAIFVVVAWIFICSATFCIWERDWDYFVAFYFFFISLSTIGLGDITPTQPKYLLMLFIYIIIGLSLVSMCINLIQAKLARTYEAGGISLELLRASSPMFRVSNTATERPQRRGSSLGVFRTSSSAHSLTKETVQHALKNKKNQNKTCQTMLSFPSPTTTTIVSKAMAQARYRFLPRSLSIDDVMRMVDTEDGDILIMTDLVRDDSGLSRSTSNTSSTENSQIVVSKSFDANFSSIQRNDGIPRSVSGGLSQRPSESDLETIEEIEDRMVLGQAQSVTFRSRLSLIPEQLPSTVEEGDEPSEESLLSPTDSTERIRKRGLLDKILHRRDRDSDSAASS